MALPHFAAVVVLGRRKRLPYIEMRRNAEECGQGEGLPTFATGFVTPLSCGYDMLELDLYVRNCGMYCSGTA
jgi:hypothetical protein